VYGGRLRAARATALRGRRRGRLARTLNIFTFSNAQPARAVPGEAHSVHVLHGKADGYTIIRPYGWQEPAVALGCAEASRGDVPS
jgi:hypothetical protein